MFLSTHYMFKLLIAGVVILLLIIGLVGINTVPQINYLSRNMDWDWHWAYFEPLSNGIQQTRTQDTRQLLLRRVYIEKSISVFVMTTLDNKLELDIVYQNDCRVGEYKNLNLLINGEHKENTAMVCETNGQSFIYRYVDTKLETLSLALDSIHLEEDFAFWPVDELKLDQFKQQHSSFFRKSGESVEHDWLRD
ncbi:threonine transporter RhtB [Vibrio genomosp. F6]|nr:threonine transporter RhtB [Vibrio genomosp. F6]